MDDIYLRIPRMCKHFAPSSICQWPNLKLPFFWAKKRKKKRKAAYEQITPPKPFPLGYQEGTSTKETAHYHLRAFTLMEDWHITVQVGWVSMAKVPIWTLRQILRKKILNRGHSKSHYCCTPAFLSSTQTHISPPVIGEKSWCSIPDKNDGNMD